MRVAIVVPCYNEEAVLPQTVKAFETLIDRIQASFDDIEELRVVFVDDGSRDGTWDLINRFAREKPWISGVKLSRNYGHQNALIAGLSSVDTDATITIDADLQDDPFAILEMLAKYKEGCDVVYGVRSERKSDTWFKRTTAQAFYRVMQWMGVESVYNHADYRLLSRRAKEALLSFREVNLFLRGMVPLIGFKSCIVWYVRSERAAGESKYPLRKMLAFAWEGITSLSTVPLRLITMAGFLLFFMALALGLWVLYERLFTDHVAPGWASMMVIILGLGGIQMLSLGVIGEYIGKIYKEVKDRPRYFIEETVKL